MGIYSYVRFPAFYSASVPLHLSGPSGGSEAGGSNPYTPPNLFSSDLSLEKHCGWVDDSQWGNSGLLPVFLKLSRKPSTLVYYMLSLGTFMLQQQS